MTDTHFGAPAPAEQREDWTPDEVEGDAVYDALRAELAKPVKVEPLPLKVPKRADFEVLYLPSIEWDLFDAWVKRASKNKEKRINPMTMAYQVLIHTCIGVKYKGQEVTANGESLTFESRELWAMVGAVNPRECVKNLYGVEGHMIQASGDVLDAAGFGDVDMEGDDENPL